MSDRGDPILTKPIKIQNAIKKEPQKERRDTLLRERRDPLYSEIPEWLQEFRENLVDDEIPVHGDSHASSSHEVSLEPTFKRREDLCKHSVYTHFLKQPKLRDLPEDKNYKGPVQETQWRSRASSWKIWWLDNSRSQGPQWQLRISKKSQICSRCRT